jgi:DNA processing protein
MKYDSIELLQPADTITPTDSVWPKRLADLAEPPLWLRVGGKIGWPEPVVAIVGTRHSDEEAELFTRRLAADVCAAGCTVISGGAYGIDAAAHQGALDARGYTVAVLATGLRSPYPPSHGPLFTRIAQRGALVTEAIDTQSPKPGLFLKRNRLIAALADVVVVVQAPYKSGALSTASWANQLSRPLLAVPCSPWDPRGQGCLDLIGQGAPICTSAEDILSVAFPTVTPAAQAAIKSANSRPSFSHNLDDETVKVLEALNAQPSYPDEIARRVSVPVERVQRSLLMLMVTGTIEELSGGRYARTVR